MNNFKVSKVVNSFFFKSSHSFKYPFISFDKKDFFFFFFKNVANIEITSPEKGY